MSDEYNPSVLAEGDDSAMSPYRGGIHNVQITTEENLDTVNEHLYALVTEMPRCTQNCFCTSQMRRILKSLKLEIQIKEGGQRHGYDTKLTDGRYSDPWQTVRSRRDPWISNYPIRQYRWGTGSGNSRHLKRICPISVIKNRHR